MDSRLNLVTIRPWFNQPQWYIKLDNEIKHNDPFPGSVHRLSGFLSLSVSSIFLQPVDNVVGMIHDQHRKYIPIPICSYMSIGDWLLAANRLLVCINVEFDEEQEVAR